ncbi:MAG: SxtJ family membrane protein [Rickettsiaceae bacterium]
MHEISIHIDSKVGSNRNFGLVFSFVFLIIGCFPLLTIGSVRSWSLVFALIFFIVALICPRFLEIPNQIWAKFGIFLGKIVTPLVMCILFFAVIVPIGFVLKRRLRKTIEIDLSCQSYWIDRSKNPVESSFQKQF